MFQKKNKDIPEGGSKGTILLRWKFQDKAEIAFKKYINGLLDLIGPEEVFPDYFGKEVILFLGPDEGTADLMEWASLRAKVMDYPYSSLMLIPKIDFSATMGLNQILKLPSRLLKN
jgi:glutamate dehydrogenase